MGSEVTIYDVNHWVLTAQREEGQVCFNGQSSKIRTMNSSSRSRFRTSQVTYPV